MTWWATCRAAAALQLTAGVHISYITSFTSYLLHHTSYTTSFTSHLLYQQALKLPPIPLTRRPLLTAAHLTQHAYAGAWPAYAMCMNNPWQHLWYT